MLERARPNIRFPTRLLGSWRLGLRRWMSVRIFPLSCKRGAGGGLSGSRMRRLRCKFFLTRKKDSRLTVE